MSLRRKMFIGDAPVEETATRSQDGRVPPHLAVPKIRWAASLMLPLRVRSYSRQLGTPTVFALAD